MLAFRPKLMSRRGPGSCWASGKEFDLYLKESGETGMGFEQALVALVYQRINWAAVKRIDWRRLQQRQERQPGGGF